MKDLSKISDAKVGLKVKRGSGWIFGNQDKGSVYGVITRSDGYDRRDNDVEVQVDWLNEHGRCVHSNSYHIGDKRHLSLYNESKIFRVKKNKNV